MEEENDIVSIKVNELKPFVYRMPKKSLGATVNLIILASKIDGVSIIKNASTEPEINDLIRYINKGGAKVFRRNSEIVIKGSIIKVKKIEHKIIPDRIECVTYMCIGTTSKKLTIKNIDINHLKMPIFYLQKAGVNIKTKKNSLIIKKGKMKNILVNSGDYPALSTDQMPLLYPLFTRVEGQSVFTEGIFENRFGVCDELRKTNANISVDKNQVFITGKKNLIKSEFYAKDLRCAASLLIECVISQGGVINNLKFLERGYCDVYNKLKKIGLCFKIKK